MIFRKKVLKFARCFIHRAEYSIWKYQNTTYTITVTLRYSLHLQLYRHIFHIASTFCFIFILNIVFCNNETIFRLIFFPLQRTHPSHNEPTSSIHTSLLVSHFLYMFYNYQNVKLCDRLAKSLYLLPYRHQSH